MMRRSKAVFPGGLAWSMRQRPEELVLRRLADGTEIDPEIALLAESADHTASLDTLLAANPQADRCTCPNLAAQLAAVRTGKIDAIICNLVDHEPVVQLNGVLARYFPRTLVAMAVDLRRMTGARRLIIAVNSFMQAFDGLREAARLRDVEVVSVEMRYPQAHATLLLYSLLKVKLPLDRLPTEGGALLIDGPALWMLSRCAREGAWPGEAPVAVRDHVRGECRYWVVHTGTPVGKLLEAGSLVESWRTVRIGDLLRAVDARPDKELGAGELVLHLINPPVLPGRSDAPCVRCGWCVDHCPVIANPAMLLEAAQENDHALALDGGLDACIECGVCDHVCPSELPLAEAIRSLKSTRQPGPAATR